jgi:hypothetical protein
VMRDPRMDPRVGDKLVKSHWTRTVTRAGKTGDWRRPAVGYDRQDDRTGHIEERQCEFEGWRRWAKYAEVLVTAPDEVTA